MMSPKPPTRWLFLTALALASVPLALLVIPGSRPSDLLLRQYREGLAQASPDERRALLRAAGRLDSGGLSLLVDTLYAEDAALGDAAYCVLREQVDQWLLHEPSGAEPMLAELAQLLASRRGQGRGETRRQVLLLAGRILLAPPSKSRENGDLVLHCEEILRSCSLESASQPGAASTVTVVDESSVSPAVVPLEAPRRPPELTDTERSEPFQQDLSTSHEQVSLVPPSAPLIYAVEESSNDDRQVVATPLDSQAGATPSNEAMPDEASPQRLGELTDREVMSRLLAEDNAAAEELSRRGYQALHLELARRLVNPDPGIRMTLLEDLPRLKSIDPRPWLIWLTRDADREVRRTTIAIIAVCRDPDLWRHLETVRSEELDPEVLRFVCRVLEERPK